jgi:Conserved TM helix
MDWRQGFETAWSNIITFVPKLVAALAVLIVGLIVARLLAKAVNLVLERVGFDRAVERGGLRRVLERSRYDPSDILAKVVFWAVVLFTLQLTFGVFGRNPVSDLLRAVIGYLPNVFVAIIILVVAGALARGATDILRSALSGVAFGAQLAMVAGAAIMVVGVFAALSQLRIAPAIVTGLFYALLAVLVGSAIVAFGGGGIPVARGYLQRAAERAEARSPEVAAQQRSQATSSAVRDSVSDPLSGLEPGGRAGRRSEGPP